MQQVTPRPARLIASVTVLVIARAAGDGQVEVDLRTLAHVPAGSHEMVAQALETFAARVRQDGSPILRPVPG